MGKVRGSMMREMTSQEFTEWQAFSLIEPIGDRRRDIQSASVCVAISSALGAKTKIKHWLPDYDKEPIEETKEQKNNRFLSILGLKIEKKKK